MQINGLILIYPDVILICQSVIVYLLSFQLLALLAIKIIKNDSLIYPYIEKLILEFYASVENDEAYNEVLENSTKLIEKVVKYGLIFTLILAQIGSIASWVTFAITGEYSLYVPVSFPFVDHQTLHGYLLNNIYLTSVTAIYSLYFVNFESFYILHNLQIIPMYRVLNIKLKCFAEELIDLNIQQEIPKKTLSEDEIEILHRSREEIEADLIEMIKFHKQIQDYNDTIENYSNYQTFTIVTTGSIAIGLSLTIAKFSSIIRGFATVVFYCFQIAVRCVLGTMIEYENEKFIDELSGFPWYELSRKNQKIYLQFLVLCQNSGRSELPIIGAVNMELFYYILDTAYSYLMFMLNMVP